MPPQAPLDSDQVHHLDAGAARGGAARTRFLLLVLALVILAAGGAWVVVADPFGSAAVAEAPPPAAGNLLGQAWSFETTDTSSAGAAWSVPADAPAGFAFNPEAAVSGTLGASAIVTESGWSRILATDPVRVSAEGEAYALSATSKAEPIQLLLRFEADGKPPVDVVVASGEGAIAGSSRVPQGYTSVRAGVGCVGAGRVDDLVLERVPAAQLPARDAPLSQGVYDIALQDGGVLLIQRDDDLALQLGPTSVRPADGRALPATAAQLPGARSLALPDGGRVGFSVALREVGETGPSGGTTTRPALELKATGAPAGATLLTHGLLVGPLAHAPVGVRTGGRFDRFTDDFRAEGIDAIVLGRTQDRLVIGLSEPFDLQATSIDDDTIALVIERPARNGVAEQLVIRAGFQEERIQAASLLDEAGAREQAGAYGEALTVLDRVVSEFPYDEQVLEQAAAAAARLRVRADERLQGLRAELDDAVVLGAPDRWRDVVDATRAEADAWRGHADVSPGFTRFLADVERAAGPVLSEVDGRRRSALEARLESFREDGRFPSVVAEIDEALAALPRAESGDGR